MTTQATPTPIPAATPAVGVGGRYQAVIFDFDGVITDTAAVRAGLAPRGLRPPDGSADDPAERLTVHGMAAREQHLFTEIPARDRVTVFPPALTLLCRLRTEGVATALINASRNAAAILAAAGVGDLFDVWVDGGDAVALGLAGKPDPAMCAEAARRLAVAPRRAVVVADAAAGVRAAVASGFGLVVGVDRGTNRDVLLAAGAHLVVGGLDLAALGLAGQKVSAQPPSVSPWCGGAAADAGPWLLAFDGFDPAVEGTREALCTLANGYWGTRGAAPEYIADDVHYPGTYLAGVFNRLRSDIGGRTVQDEAQVNAPNWLPLTVRHPEGDWIRPDGPGVLEHRQELDLRRGLLTRTVRYRDQAGRTTRVTSRRLVSKAAAHLAALETTIEAEDWSGPLQVRSTMDASVTNRGVAEYRALADRHLQPVTTDPVDAETVLIEVVTNQSGIGIAMAARTRAHRGGTTLTPQRRMLAERPGEIGHELDLDLQAGVPVTVEKVVAVATSRDPAISTPALSAQFHLSQAGDFADLLAAHEQAWASLWDDFAVAVTTGDQASEQAGLALNLHTFHVLQTASADADLDAGLPARGLAGEGYRGHVFWDEMFIYPMLTLRRPDLTRALLRYRHRRLDAARAAARTAGLAGALFPWQSGSDGREETPTQLYNPRSDRWMPDNSHRQRHVGLAVAYSVLQYHQATGDVGFLAEMGAELLVEVARCFTAMTTYDSGADRYDIAGVMGPDEFHDGYPDAPGAGVRNNAYTNIMTAWTLRRTGVVLDLLDWHDCGALRRRLGVQDGELARWEHVSRRLRVAFHADGVLSQFDGYEQLAEFDWDGYRARYPNIGRLDLILAAEGQSTNNYRLSKQADVLMLFYLLSAEELRDTLDRMGYPLPPEAVRATVEFYTARTSHGSTLSRLVHAWVLARADRHRSWSLFTQALHADLADTQGGTTREGVHLGAMAGTVDLILRCYAGLETRDDVLWLHPQLPPELDHAQFQISYRRQQVQVELSPQLARLRLPACAAAPIQVCVQGQRATLHPGGLYEAALRTATPST